MDKRKPEYLIKLSKNDWPEPERLDQKRPPKCLFESFQEWVTGIREVDKNQPQESQQKQSRNSQLESAGKEKRFSGVEIAAEGKIAVQNNESEEHRLFRVITGVSRPIQKFAWALLLS